LSNAAFPDSALTKTVNKSLLTPASQYLQRILLLFFTL